MLPGPFSFPSGFGFTQGLGSHLGGQAPARRIPQACASLPFPSWLPHDAHNVMLRAGPGPENKAGPVLPRRRGWAVGTDGKGRGVVGEGPG